jgi:hypothetical protein
MRRHSIPMKCLASMICAIQSTRTVHVQHGLGRQEWFPASPRQNKIQVVRNYIATASVLPTSVDFGLKRAGCQEENNVGPTCGVQQKVLVADHSLTIDHYFPNYFHMCRASCDGCQILVFQMIQSQRWESK